MQIGELAHAVDCSVETVRYYEKAGLIPPAHRATNGYRIYNGIHLKLLRLIRRARSLGFSQEQVFALTTLANSQDSSCNEVLAITRQQLVLVKLKQRELQRVARALKKLVGSCEQGDHTSCPVLDELISDR